MIKLVRLTVHFQLGDTPQACFNLANLDADGLLSGAGSRQLTLTNGLSVTLNDGTVLTGQQIRQALRKLSEQAT